MRSAPFLAAALAALGAASPAAGAPRTYVLDAAASEVRIHVGRAGLFSFAGHEHDVAAPALQGEVVADAADLAASSVRIRFPARTLTVIPDREPEGDAPKVQEAMLGEKVLDVARYPEITFTSRAVSGRADGATYRLEVTGDLTLHGVTRTLSLPVAVTVDGDRLIAEGRTVLRHDHFGMKPVSVAGVVKVKNEIVVSYKFVGRAEPVK